MKSFAPRPSLFNFIFKYWRSQDVKIERCQLKIMQIITKQMQGKREVGSVNTISMSTALLSSLNDIKKRMKTRNAFIDDTYH